MKFYIATLYDNGTGITADSKEDFLNRMSQLIDECEEAGVQNFDVSVDADGFEDEDLEIDKLNDSPCANCRDRGACEMDCIGDCAACYGNRHTVKEEDNLTCDYSECDCCPRQHNCCGKGLEEAPYDEYEGD